METRSFPLIQVSALVLIFVVFILGALSAGNQRQMYMVIWVFGYVIILLGGVNLVKNFLRSRKLSTGLTRALTIVFSITLSLALMFGTIRMMLNFTDVEYEGYSHELEVNETIFVAEYEATQQPRMDALEYPSLYYRIVKVKVPLFYDMCFKEMLEEVEFWRHADGYVEEEFREQYKVIDTDSWQSDAAYREYTGDQPWNNYLICWGNKIVEIRFPEEPTEAQIAAVAQKLKDF